MNKIPANLIYSQNELERWFDDTSVQPSDDQMKAMSAYFRSESFQITENNLCDMIDL